MSPQPHATAHLAPPSIAHLGRAACSSLGRSQTLGHAVLVGNPARNSSWISHKYDFLKSGYDKMTVPLTIKSQVPDSIVEQEGVRLQGTGSEDIL